MKKQKILLLAALLMLTLSGCVFGIDGSETLYRLPRLPSEYESLEQQIDEVLASGAEHAAPTSGNNLQSVQMVDLDGDGTEEAVAFFRKNDDKKPMKIYIFRARDDAYSLAYTIEGTSDSIYSIAYNDLNGDGYRELLVGYRSSLEVQGLFVVDLSTGEPKPLLTTGYSRYISCDMDGSGKQELIVIRSDEENLAVADYYDWEGDALALRTTLGLSMTAAEVKRLTSGSLANGETALFITGTRSEGGEITDILTARDGTLQRVGAETVAVSEISRFASLYPTDINNDGITEVPNPTPFPKTDPEGETYYRIFWQQYDERGKATTVYRTLHNMQDGWCLVMPEAWDDTVSVLRQSTAGGSTVVFYRYGDADLTPFMEISSFTGDAREYQAVREGRFLLTQQVDATYAALLSDPDMMTEETLRESFSLLTAEWTTGEN